MIITFYIEKTIDEFGNITNRKKVSKKDYEKVVTTLISTNFPSRIVYATLRNLRSKGNTASADLLNGKNGLIETSDLIADTWEKCLILARYGFITTCDGVVALNAITTPNNNDVIEIDNLAFSDIPTYKEYTDKRNNDKTGLYETPVIQYLAKGVNDTLLSLRTYGNKRIDLYTTVETKDGLQECSIFDVGALAKEYANKFEIPTIEKLTDGNKVYKRTLDIIKASKNAQTDIELLRLRSIGCTWKNCALHMNRTIKFVRCGKARLEKAYKQALKECGKIAKTDDTPTYGNKNIFATAPHSTNYNTSVSIGCTPIDITAPKNAKHAKKGCRVW